MKLGQIIDIQRVANGWLVRPAVRHAEYHDLAEFRVFNRLEDLTAFVGWYFALDQVESTQAPLSEVIR